MRRLPATLLMICLVTALVLTVIVFQPLGVVGSVLVPPSEPSSRGVVGLVERRAGALHGWIVRTGMRIGLWLSGRSILPGWYHIDADASDVDVVYMLVAGKREPLVKVTIPEGYTIREIAGRLRARAEIDSVRFVSWCQADSVLRRWDVGAASMEGFLMPDTYFVIRQDEADLVGAMMARQARRMWSEILPDSASRGWQDRLRLATLASIVQLEAGQNDEMPRIAGVYENRLRIGMRLQADPTVQYLTGKDRILRSELQDASNAYNTYVRVGLPPGPICNPGKNALVAARSPERHEWLYFVARGDGSRRHRFSRTLAEHNENVRQYRRSISARQ